ncbi:hypothetical protein [uncultured Cohaesibacter sp.]|uniref:hypothetical protein n=1 Tax=uncultured Cohaesibacter sp. TaxID=1002546 RepID=UPI002AA92568|nr:hypothetical protein [uncultured Cohaesibacter sp.]
MAANNRQRNRQRPGASSPRSVSSRNGNSARHLMTGASFSRFIANFRKDFSELFGKAFETPIQAIGGAFSFVATGASILPLFAGSGSSSAGSSSSLLGISSFLTSNFPIRAVVFIVIAASIAFIISAIGKLLTLVSSEVVMIIAHFITLLAGLFIAANVDWIFAQDMKNNESLVLLCASLCIALAMYVAKANFYHSIHQSTAIQLRRAGLMANLALSTSVGTILLLIL